MMMRAAALLALVTAVLVFWQPLLVWVQSMMLMTFALLCWRAGGKDGNSGQRQ